MQALCRQRYKALLIEKELMYWAFIFWMCFERRVLDKLLAVERADSALRLIDQMLHPNRDMRALSELITYIVVTNP